LGSGGLGCFQGMSPAGRDTGAAKERAKKKLNRQKRHNISEKRRTRHAKRDYSGWETTRNQQQLTPAHWTHTWSMTGNCTKKNGKEGRGGP